MNLDIKSINNLKKVKRRIKMNEDNNHIIIKNSEYKIGGSTPSFGQDNEMSNINSNSNLLQVNKPSSTEFNSNKNKNLFDKN